MQTHYSLDKERQEQAGYFQVPGAHLYTVVHRVADPVARVLLVGAFASERHNSYIPWVRWARYLAAKGVEVLRFDYRGIGESEGVFEEMSFPEWSQDVECLATWLGDLDPKVPLLLHGLEMGALLAGRAFHQGIGDALLLWAPPANANQALRSTLLRWVGLAQIFKYGDERKPPSAYIRELEEGSFIEVDGYQWSGRLWQESFAFQLPSTLADDASARSEYKKPVRIVKLGKEAVPLVKGGVLGYDEVKDFNWLFAENWDWISGNLGNDQGIERNEAGD